MKITQWPSLAGRSTMLLIAACVFAILVTPACNKDDDPPARMDIELVADGFVSPVGLVASPDNTGRLFVIDQVGKIWIIDKQATNFLHPSWMFRHHSLPFLPIMMKKDC